MSTTTEEVIEKWLTPQMYCEGWYELRNGIVYHRRFHAGHVIRRDEHGNYLVRITVPRGK